MPNLCPWKVLNQRRYRVSKLPKVGTLQLCTRFAHTLILRLARNGGVLDFSLWSANALKRIHARSHAYTLVFTHQSEHFGCRGDQLYVQGRLQTDA